MKFSSLKGSLLATLLVALIMSCTDHENINPAEKAIPISTETAEPTEIIVYETPDFTAQGNTTEESGRVAAVPTIKIVSFTGYFNRTAGATGKIYFELYKKGSATPLIGSNHVDVSVFPTNGYVILTFNFNKNLEENQTYRMEVRCSGCSDPATGEKINWWRGNGDLYDQGMAVGNINSVWTPDQGANDFAFKIQNKNSDGTTYTSRAQFAKNVVRPLNASSPSPLAQTFKPERGDDYIIPFTDPDLETVIRQAAGLAAGVPVTIGDAKRVTFLDVVSDVGISSLEGIQYATNLTTLNLGSNAITDITPLATLTKLTTLMLFNMQITDIAPLVGLTNLINLTIARNQITSLTPLAGLHNLTSLNVENNPITSISSLATLTNLTSLIIYQCQVTNLSPLSNLTKLNVLYLGNAGITNITPIAGLTELNSLNMGDFPIADLSPIASLSKLNSLHLRNSHVTNITLLSGLTNLTVLKLDNNQITDVRPLVGLTKLVNLDLTRNQLNNVSSLNGLTSLKWLSLTSNPLTQLQIDALQQRLPNTVITF